MSAARHAMSEPTWTVPGGKELADLCRQTPWTLQDCRSCGIPPSIEQVRSIVVDKQVQGLRSSATAHPGPNSRPRSGRPVTGWSVAETRCLDTVDRFRQSQAPLPEEDSWRNTPSRGQNMGVWSFLTRRPAGGTDDSMPVVIGPPARAPLTHPSSWQTWNRHGPAWQDCLCDKQKPAPRPLRPSGC